MMSADRIKRLLWEADGLMFFSVGFTAGILFTVTMIWVAFAILRSL